MRLGCLLFLNRNDIPSESIKQADQGIIHRFHHVQVALEMSLFFDLNLKKLGNLSKVNEKSYKTLK